MARGLFRCRSKRSSRSTRTLRPSACPAERGSVVPRGAATCCWMQPARTSVGEDVRSGAGRPKWAAGVAARHSRRASQERLAAAPSARQSGTSLRRPLQLRPSASGVTRHLGWTGRTGRSPRPPSTRPPDGGRDSRRLCRRVNERSAGARLESAQLGKTGQRPSESTRSKLPSAHPWRPATGIHAASVKSIVPRPAVNGNARCLPGTVVSGSYGGRRTSSGEGRSPRRSTTSISATPTPTILSRLIPKQRTADSRRQANNQHHTRNRTVIPLLAIGHPPDAARSRTIPRLCAHHIAQNEIAGLL